MTAPVSPLSIRLIMLALRDLASTISEDFDAAAAMEEEENLLAADSMLAELCSVLVCRREDN
jgi:hypothetical protein